MDSIMQRTKECYICGANGSCDPLDKHHTFGGAFRNKSEQYGLWVYLCHAQHHIFGRDSVHQDIETMRRLQREAQMAAMKRYGWTTEEFIRIFGRNYI